MDSPARPSAGVFRHRDFRLFWATRFTSTLGVQAEGVAIGWQVYDAARSGHASVEQGAFLVGMVGLVQFLPLFALTLIAGETADRYPRRTVVLLCLAAEVVLVGALAVLALGPAPSLPLIFGVAGLFGASRAFLSPASGAMGPMLVPREELPRAVAWNSLAWQTGAIVGPMIGGLLCGVSPAAAYAAAGALYLVSAGCMALLRTDTRPARREGVGRLELIREGLHYVWANKIVFGSISLDLFAVLLGGATALLPVFARDVLGGGAETFGVLRAGPAIGAGIVAFVLSRTTLRRHAGRWMFLAVGLFGVATAAFALSRAVWLSVVLLAVLGGADMISVYVRQTLVQIVTPDPMRGRVSAVSGLFIGASNELGEFETGVAARVLGPVMACFIGGVGAVGVTGLWAALFPDLRRADRLDAPAAP